MSDMQTIEGQDEAGSRDVYKILVVSDSHGANPNLRKAVALEEPFDTLVHCGDVEGNLGTILGDVPFGIVCVRGNCDHDLRLPEEAEFKAGFLNVFVTHGHKYDVKYDAELGRLGAAGRRKCADIVLFGHSHVPVIEHQDNMLLLNPGTIGRARYGGESTYAVITITDGSVIDARIGKLPE